MTIPIDRGSLCPRWADTPAAPVTDASRPKSAAARGKNANTFRSDGISTSLMPDHLEPVRRRIAMGAESVEGRRRTLRHSDVATEIAGNTRSAGRCRHCPVHDQCARAREAFDEVVLPAVVVVVIVGIADAERHAFVAVDDPTEMVAAATGDDEIRPAQGDVHPRSGLV